MCLSEEGNIKVFLKIVLAANVKEMFERQWRKVTQGSVNSKSLHI